MAMIYSVREISRDGKGTGRFRHVGLSDESASAVDELCDCDNGHASREEAEACPKAKARLDKLFHRDIESLERHVDQARRKLCEAEFELATARAGGNIDDGKMGAAEPWDHSDFS